MKQIFIGLFCIACISGYSQDLLSNPWRIDQVIGRDTNNLNEFTLQKVDTSNRHWNWGNILRFFSDGTFMCEYRAQCGNDCFPSSNGTYYLTDNSQVVILLNEYNQRGYCDEIHWKAKKTIGTYLIVGANDETLKLVRRKK